MKPMNSMKEYFLGCLYSTNYKNLSSDKQKEILLENNIYLIDDDNFWDHAIVVYSRDPLTVLNSEMEVKLGEDFIYLNNKYKINILLLKEIFQYLKENVIANNAQPLDIRIKEITLHVQHLKYFDDVTHFYREHYREVYDKLKENECFFIYHEPQAWHYLDWEDYVTEEIKDNSHLIETHLLSEYGYCSFEEISKNWEDIDFSNEILSYLKAKITSSTDDSLSKLIFKENGEEIFNYIAQTCQEEKKPAFYTYLYYFLRDELKKLKLQDEHSDSYTSYVVKKGYLKSYGRMQKPRSESKNKYNSMMNLFYEIYSLKFEQKLSKDE